MADFKGNISRLYWHRQPVDVMHWEVTFVGCGWVITVGNIENVVRNILFNDEPGATGKAHTLALTDGTRAHGVHRCDAPSQTQ